ncbi:MAG: hypothetical protein WCZ98_04055 [Sideroxydans sp.]
MKISTAVVWVTLAFASSISVFAGDYEDAAKRQKYCSEDGDWAAKMYDERNDASAVKIQLMVFDGIDIKHPSKRKGVAVLRKIAKYAYFEATSRTDAYTRGWAICMDRQ